MQRFLTSLVLTLALGLGAEPATALGLGKVSAAPVLGQPLNFTIRLRLDSSESLEARCARADVTFGDRVLPDVAVRTRLETANAGGERRLRVTTTVPVDEPVVALQLHLGCPPSLSRGYTLFAEPPGRLAQAGAATEEGWVPDRADTAVSPVLAAIPPEAQASAAVAGVTRTRKRRSEGVADLPSRASVAAASSQGAGESTARPRRAARAGKVARGPVLRLDPVEADAMISPSLQMDTRLSPMSEGGASAPMQRPLDPEQAQRQQDVERLKAMEATLLKLRTDSQATQKSLADMQLRVRAAEAARYSNPLVYLLTLLCLLLAAGLAAMWWLRRRDRAAAAWWTAQPPVESVVPTPDPTAPATVVSEPAALPVLKAEPVSAPAPLAPTFPTMSPIAPRTVPEPDGAVVEPRRPMSAEELIDLEQQAEFFVVLGQDDAAIDLLMGHVRSTGGVSPLPYIKLLEIYRRRGEREPYDRIRERFNRRFNAYAPEWDVDPEQGLSLEGYPEVMQRLQDVWPTPTRAMEMLDAALFRRDSGPTFDVPAYRELLFLYSTARDLAERDIGSGGVDLLLPMGDEPRPTLTQVQASSPTFEKLDDVGGFSLDLDVSTDQPPLSLEDPEFKRSDR